MSPCRNGCTGYHSSGPTDGSYIGGGDPNIGYSGDPISDYLPHFCPCRDCCYRYTGGYSGGNGVGGGE
jgi:hypothetical protein